MKLVHSFRCKAGNSTNKPHWNIGDSRDGSSGLWLHLEPDRGLNEHAELFRGSRRALRAAREGQVVAQTAFISRLAQGFVV